MTPTPLTPPAASIGAAPDSALPDAQGRHFDADVAIIGYGPSGVAAANCLGAYGLTAVAFERERDIYPRARAVTVNDWTLRCFQSVGLDQELLRDMDPTTALRWITYARKELLRVSFEPSYMGQPMSSMIYQPVMEQTLRRGAARYADRVQVHFGQQVQRVEQDAQGVNVTVADTETGATRSVRVRYALACDGGSSGVRTQLGVKLIGSTLDTKWVVIDARVKRWWPERHLLTFWSDAKRPVVDIPLALGNHRWEIPLSPHESEADFSTQEQIWPLLRAMGVTPDDVEIHQHAFYKHHVRHAERWRIDRVFLLGDAAHMMPPWAGQGMQSGIRDAFNLCWKLRDVVQGRLPPSILDSYEAERAPNVARVTAGSERLGRVIKMQMTGAEKAVALRDMVLRALHLPLPPSPLSIPPVMDTGWLSGTATAKNAVGKMIPQPQVALTTGKRGRLDDVLGHDFVLLGDELDPASLLSAQERAGWDALGARYIAVRSGDQASTASTDVIDLDGSLRNWLRRHGTRAVAVRPDRFVAAAHGTGLGVPR